NGGLQLGRSGGATQGQRLLESGERLLPLPPGPMDQPDLVERRRLAGLVLFLFLQIEGLIQSFQRSGRVAQEATDSAGLVEDAGLARLVAERAPALQGRAV